MTHPLVQHKLTKLRDKATSSTNFRRLLREIGLLLGYDATRDLPMVQTRIETPIEAMDAPMLDGKKLVVVPILRAGLGLAEGVTDLVPLARVGHVGLYRDPHTLTPVEYYLKLPDDMAERVAVVVDPMLATGNSAAAAVARIKQAGATDIRFVCLLSAPEGLQAFHDEHPEVPIFTCAIDRGLDDHGYIRPGLGDAGDRLYGTK